MMSASNPTESMPKVAKGQALIYMTLKLFTFSRVGSDKCSGAVPLKRLVPFSWSSLNATSPLSLSRAIRMSLLTD